MKNLLLLLSFFFVSITLSQENKEAIPFVAYWAKGDSYDFRVTKIKQKIKRGVIEKNDSSSYKVNFQVIDSTEKNYKIKWSYETDLKKLNIPAKFLGAFSKYKKTDVVYTTDELGAFIAIENWKEIATMMQNLFADAIEVVDDSSAIDKDEFSQAMKPLLKIYNSKEGIEQLVFKELQYFHRFFGLEYPIGKKIQYEEELPNMFGGKAIKGDAQIYIDSINLEKNYCALVQEMKLNPKDTKNVITTLFKKMKMNNKEVNEALKSAQFDIVDFNKYEYDYILGVPIKIEANRQSLIQIASEEGIGIDKTIIELIR